MKQQAQKDADRKEPRCRRKKEEERTSKGKEEEVAKGKL
jgi:hypothetical protein